MSPLAMSPGATHEHYVGIGVVQARVAALLSEGAGGEFATSIAERSPLGTRVIRVRRAGGDPPAAEACRELATWLDAQPWVEASTPRPPHVYVRVATPALRTWVVSGFAGSSPALGDEGAGRRVVVQVPEWASPGPQPLEAFREAAIGRSVGALLRSRGFRTNGDGGPTGAAPDDGRRAQAAGAARCDDRPVGTVLIGRATPSNGGPVVRAPVGGVDIRHGALRARHGGTVSADDLLGELEGLPGYAEGLLAFVVLHTQRARRVQLDDAKIGRETDAFDSVLSARAIAHAGAHDAPVPAPDDGNEDAVRELAVEIDLLPTVTARAASALEPVFLARFVHSLANRTHVARPHLPPGDPLWTAVSDALDTALALAGIEIPAETWRAAAGPLDPWTPKEALHESLAR